MIDWGPLIRKDNTYKEFVDKLSPEEIDLAMSAIHDIKLQEALFDKLEEKGE